jgi:phosphoribosylaminoimidazole-succinocarboxamide synthase
MNDTKKDTQSQKSFIETNLNIGKKYVGKVRDTYDLGDKLILISTDRQSAFDRILASIPHKGEVLNLTSAWWFEKTQHIIPNHVLSVPDPRVTVAKKCEIFPIEFVIRGYITGTTSTSAWTNYEKGVRDFCGNLLDEGLQKNQKFKNTIITPTTKDKHDTSITPDEIISSGRMSKEEWEYVKRKSFELFNFGQMVAKENGLILVDTKYEFGKDKSGDIILCDEIHTPDSSRYWIANSYEERFAKGQEPENIDKEFLRLWFRDNCDPYNDRELPAAPPELVSELSKRYVQLYEMITGREFEYSKDDMVMDRIKKNLNRFVGTSDLNLIIPTVNVTADKNTWQVSDPTVEPKTSVTTVLILGSTSDEPFAKKITDELDKLDLVWQQHVASAHKQANEALKILQNNSDRKVIYITIAGRSNALSGFVAGNSNKPTIACPPFKDKTDMMVNLNSSVQMPSKVPVMTILEPLNVAIAIRRIIDLKV